MSVRHRVWTSPALCLFLEDNPVPGLLQILKVTHFPWPHPAPSHPPALHPSDDSLVMVFHHITAVVTLINMCHLINCSPSHTCTQQALTLVHTHIRHSPLHAHTSSAHPYTCTQQAFTLVHTHIRRSPLHAHTAGAHPYTCTQQALILTHAHSRRSPLHMHRVGTHPCTCAHQVLTLTRAHIRCSPLHMPTAGAHPCTCAKKGPLLLKIHKIRMVILTATVKDNTPPKWP